MFPSEKPTPRDYIVSLLLASSVAQPFVLSLLRQSLVFTGVFELLVVACGHMVSVLLVLL
jgi:hypothetical protein